MSETDTNIYESRWRYLQFIHIRDIHLYKLMFFNDVHE